MVTPAVRTFLRAALLLVLPTIVVCVVVLEIGLRLLGRLPSNQTEGIFEAHGEAYRLRPNQTKIFRTPSFTCTIHTNAFGLRDRTTGPRELSRPYIAWLGDSATFANGVEFEESFVGRFGALAERDGIEVVNLAVGGHHLGEQEDMLRDFVAAAPRRPDRVVAVLTPQLLALFEKRHKNLVFKNGYGFPKDAWLKPYLLVTLGDASSAYCFFRDAVRRVQGKLLPRGAEAASEMLDIYARTYPAASPDATRRLEQRLVGLDRTIAAAGAVPVNVYLPTTADLRVTELISLSGRSAGAYDFDHWRDVVRRASAEAGAQFVDLTDVLRAEHAKGAPLGFMQDMHYNAKAHVPIARALYHAILEKAPAAPGTAGRAPPGVLRPVAASGAAR